MMANLELGPKYEEIGRLVAEDVRADPEGTYLYAEAGEGWVEVSIFKDLGESLIYREGSHDLCWALLDVWEAEEPDKRWSALHYVISDGKFEVSFDYWEAIDPEESSLDRRERAIRERFGDKAVDYSDP